jgi:hypothetical protein
MKKHSILQVIIMALALTTTAVVLHEAGHMVAGALAGCKDIKILLFDASLETYTSMQCPGGISANLISLSGFLLVIPFAIAVYFQGGYDRFYSLVILGFNFMISGSDLSVLGNIVSNLAAMSGAAMILFAENKIISFHMDFGMIRQRRKLPMV